MKLVEVAFLTGLRRIDDRDWVTSSVFAIASKGLSEETFRMLVRDFSEKLAVPDSRGDTGWQHVFYFGSPMIRREIMNRGLLRR